MTFVVGTGLNIHPNILLNFSFGVPRMQESVWSNIRVNRRFFCSIPAWSWTVTVTEEVCVALCAYNQPRLSSLIGAGWGYATAAVKTKLSSQKDDRPCPLNQPPHRLTALGRARPGASLSAL